MAESTAACKVPNFTIFSEILVLKFVPEIVIVVPTVPDDGLNDIIRGAIVTVNELLVDIVIPLTVK